MKNDFDAIRAATTEPPREGMMRTTKKTSSSRQKIQRRIGSETRQGGDEERKREFQRQMDQFKRMEEKEEEKGNYNAPRQRRGDDAYQDEETVFNRAPVPKGMSRFSSPAILDWRKLSRNCPQKRLESAKHRNRGIWRLL